MNDVIAHAKQGRLVLGICNGAQILAESVLCRGIHHQCLPEVHLQERAPAHRDHGFAVYVPVPERRCNQDPIAHKEGGMWLRKTCCVSSIAQDG